MTWLASPYDKAAFDLPQRQRPRVSLRLSPVLYGKGLMDETITAKILELLDQHRLMSVATNRPDSWPQATTVGYVNDGLTIYFLCSPQSQKAQNLVRDNRISLTIDHDTSDPMAISGLSMAAQAQPGVTDPAEITKAC